MLSEATLQETIAFTQDLIRVDSPSWKEQAVSELVLNKMRSLGYDSVLRDSLGNIIGVRIGDQPGPTILFDGHMDVVPAKNPESWSSDPFSGEIRDGKIYGRGATDMKGPLAAAIMAVGSLPANTFRGKLVVSASVGEEVFEGAALASVLDAYTPDFVVICEPNDCHLGIGQKGRAGLWLKVHGTTAHSSQPHLGENAIYKALPIIERLKEMSLPDHPRMGKGIMALIDAISEPYPSQSSLPFCFKLRYDRRLVLGETNESVLHSISEALKDFDGWEMGFNPIYAETYTGEVLEGPDFHPGWLIPESSPWIRSAKKGLTALGMESILVVAHYCTNGSQSAGIRGIPTMIFGPSDIAQAHADDEHIEISELQRGVEAYTSLAKHLSKS